MKEKQQAEVQKQKDKEAKLLAQRQQQAAWAANLAQGSVIRQQDPRHQLGHNPTASGNPNAAKGASNARREDRANSGVDIRPRYPPPSSTITSGDAAAAAPTPTTSGTPPPPNDPPPAAPSSQTASGGGSAAPAGPTGPASYAAVTGGAVVAPGEAPPPQRSQRAELLAYVREVVEGDQPNHRPITREDWLRINEDIMAQAGRMLLDQMETARAAQAAGTPVPPPSHWGPSAGPTGYPTTLGDPAALALVTPGNLGRGRRQPSPSIDTVA